MRVLELFCGIGGVAAALGEVLAAGGAEVVAAVDLDRTALAVYGANFRHPLVPRTLDRVAAAELAAHRADLWTMSPPCQPYTRRGLRRDLDDPRAASFPALVAALDAVRPPYLFLENVPGFAGSRAHALLRQTLEGAGYEVGERLLCPSTLGLPNRRLRFYLVASRDGRLALPPDPAPPETARRPLAAFLEALPDPELTVPREVVAAYRHALDVVDPADPMAVTACFTAAYGRSPVRSGSYLRLGRDPGPQEIGSQEIDGEAALPVLRRLSPREVLALLGFPAAYRLPPELPRGTAWRLAGNSLSLPPVRAMLASLPPLGALRSAARSLADAAPAPAGEAPAPADAAPSAADLAPAPADLAAR